MNRQQLFDLVRTQYSVEPDYPWDDDNAVLRHFPGKKWFGVILNVRLSQLGLNGDQQIDILNVKCDPLLIGSFRQKQGIHPAWHMNKSSWLSIRLDGSAADEDIQFLLERSWELTEERKKGR